MDEEKQNMDQRSYPNAGMTEGFAFVVNRAAAEGWSVYVDLIDGPETLVYGPASWFTLYKDGLFVATNEGGRAIPYTAITSFRAAKPNSRFEFTDFDPDGKAIEAVLKDYPGLLPAPKAKKKSAKKAPQKELKKAPKKTKARKKAR
jgi:hypothetical protein